MNSKISIWFLLAGLLVSVQCKRLDKDEVRPVKIKNVFKELEDNQFQYQTFFAKSIKVNYVDTEQKISSKGYLKVIKDEAIQVSLAPALGIEMARLYVFKDSIYFINRLEKTVYVTNFQSISGKAGVNLNFSDLQNLLLNQFIFDPGALNIVSKKTDVIDNKHIIKVEDEFNGTIVISDKDYRILEYHARSLDKSSELDIMYDGFNEKGKANFPEVLSLALRSGEDIFQISIQMKNIRVNEDFNIVYKKPSNYGTKNLFME